PNVSQVLVIQGAKGLIRVTYVTPTNLPTHLPPDPALPEISRGLTGLFSAPVGQALDQVDLPVLGQSIGSVADGAVQIQPNNDPDANGTDPDQAAGVAPGLIERIFEEGAGAFDPDDIGGPTIPDLSTFQQDLLNLSDPGDPGAVSYTVDPVTGFVRFDVTINK